MPMTSSGAYSLWQPAAGEPATARPTGRGGAGWGGGGTARGRGVAGDGEADGAGRVELVGGAHRARDVVALHRARTRAELVADRPDEDRRVVAVDEDVVAQLLGGELAHEALLEPLGAHRVDRDL